MAATAQQIEAVTRSFGVECDAASLQRTFAERDRWLRLRDLVHDLDDRCHDGPGMCDGDVEDVIGRVRRRAARG